MTPRSPDAIAAALAMLRDPHLTRLAQRSPLPKGTAFLLELAAGEAEALAAAHAMTGRSEATLQKAAGFFIEQVLLSPHGDSYRVLGAGRDTPSPDLRRHMALILKWLHPDLFAGPPEGRSLNRSAYVNLVTKAWETLKTGERRAAYDAALADKERSSKRRSSPLNRNGAHLKRNSAAGAHSRRSQNLRARRPILYRLEPDSFWSRFLSFIGIIK